MSDYHDDRTIAYHRDIVSPIEYCIYRWLHQTDNNRYGIAPCSKSGDVRGSINDTFKYSYKAVYVKFNTETVSVYKILKTSLYDPFYVNNYASIDEDTTTINQNTIVEDYNRDDMLYLKELFHYCDIKVMHNKDEDRYWLSCKGANIIYVLQYERLLLNHVQAGSAITRALGKLLGF